MLEQFTFFRNELRNTNTNKVKFQTKLNSRILQSFKLSR